jgi:hypothetical protein
MMRQAVCEYSISHFGECERLIRDKKPAWSGNSWQSQENIGAGADRNGLASFRNGTPGWPGKGG